TLARIDSGTQVVGELAVPFVAAEDPGEGRLVPARIVVTHSLASLAALRRGVDRWLLAAVAVSGGLALLLGGWLSSRISRPLSRLAEQTSEIDMDRLDVAFASARNDARLYPQPASEPCDVNEAVRETVRRLGDAGRAELRTELADNLSPVRTDRLVLRRILENLVGNALDSLESRPGAVTVSTAC